MADAIQRWFVDTLRNAKNGDINQAALLAEMLATGYGCNKDLDEAGERGGGRRLVFTPAHVATPRRLDTFCKASLIHHRPDRRLTISEPLEAPRQHARNTSLV